MPQVDLTDGEARKIAFVLSCYLDDYEKVIKKGEKSGELNESARNFHANLTRLTYTKIVPESLRGDLKLLDGTTLRKGSKQ